MLFVLDYNDISYELCKLALILIRDLCKFSNKTSELMSRHESEGNLLKVL